MARTGFTSGDITASGTFTFNNPGFEYIPAHPKLISEPNQHFYHSTGDFHKSFTLGPVTVSVTCVDTAWSWNITTQEWENVSGDPNITGFPDAFGDPGATRCGIAIGRAFLIQVTAGGESDSEYTNAGYWVKTYDPPCNVMPGNNISFDVSNISSFNLSWSISLDALYLYYSIASTDLGGGMSYPVHPDQLQFQSWWQNDEWEVTGTCGTVSATDVDYTYSSQSFPTWSASCSYGVGAEFEGLMYSEICENELMCIAGFAYSRMADSQSLTYGLSSQFPGLRASGSEVDYVDTTYLDDVATYTFGSGSLSGSVTSATNTTSCCDTPHTITGTFGHIEWGRVTSKGCYDLVAFDQMTSLSGLKATATYIGTYNLDWDEASQSYIRSEGWGTSTEISVPGSDCWTFAQTSRYDDSLATGELRATYINSYLTDLDLPTADDKAQFEMWGLDCVTHPSWGTNYYGKYYDTLLKCYRQNPLSVAWCQDDRGEAAPPSWWVLSGGNASLERNTQELVITTTETATISRTLKHYVWDIWTNADVLIAEPGTPEEDLWMYGFDWSQTARKTKHILEGTEVYASTGINAEGNVYDPETEEIDHYATGNLPTSEDVYHWQNYGYLGLEVSWSEEYSFNLTMTVTYSTFTITDSHVMDNDERQAAWLVDSVGGQTAEYSIRIPASANHSVVYVDLIEPGLPVLQVVENIVISGIPVGTLTIHEMGLCGYNPETAVQTGKFVVDVVFPRRMKYGGYGAYSCGDSEFLGNVQLPEEATGMYGWAEAFPGLNSPDGEITDRPMTPEGIEFFDRKIPTCGKSQDQLYTFDGFYNMLAGTWGQEGIYGVLGDKTTEAVWTDSNKSTLGPNYSSDFKELLYFQIADENLLNIGRTAAGNTAIPYSVRVGSCLLAEGMCWANSGNPITIGSKKIFYGSRPDLAYWNNGSQFHRVGSGYSFQLIEENITDATLRTVGTYTTDAWGFLRGTKGINEYLHTEDGSDPGSNPDASRDDFQSYWIAPDGTYSTTKQHYQECPSSYIVYYKNVPGCNTTAYLSVHGKRYRAFINSDGEIDLEWFPDAAGTAWLDVDSQEDAWCPRLIEDSSGACFLFYGSGTSISLRQIVLDTWENAVELLTGYSCFGVTTLAIDSSLYVACLTTEDPYDLDFVRVIKDVSGNWQVLPAVSIDTDVDYSAPNIAADASGRLYCHYSKGEAVQLKYSDDQGDSWI